MQTEASKAGAGLGVYIVGLPFGMFLVLYKNRKHLFDVASKEHERVKASFGGLYLQYEEEYWWFEMVVVLEKMIDSFEMDISEDILLNVSSAVIVRTISMLKPPPLRKSTVIRFGGAVKSSLGFLRANGMGK